MLWGDKQYSTKELLEILGESIGRPLGINIYYQVRAVRQHAEACCFLLEVDVILFPLVSY